MIRNLTILVDGRWGLWCCVRQAFCYVGLLGKHFDLFASSGEWGGGGLGGFLRGKIDLSGHVVQWNLDASVH